ncbi:uncharacterized protein LOC143910547 [Arctopsyche grandis]|uniref:uncharacterized protein LOC143910547 n=1 Tax=Arctopsyche grandis TaxID=121162 RepID=UPI00406D86A2
MEILFRRQTSLMSKFVQKHPCQVFTEQSQSNMLLLTENSLLHSHRQRETTGIKKLYNSFFVLF